MLKVVSLLKRAEHLSHEEFVRWLLEDHVEFARKLPGLRGYKVNVTIADGGAFDAANELFFDDEAARAAALGSEIGRAAAADADAHTAQRVHLMTTEHTPL